MHPMIGKGSLRPGPGEGFFMRSFYSREIFVAFFRSSEAGFLPKQAV
jgi:hypothetical protein